MRWGALIIVLAMFATAAACACKGGSKGGSTGNGTGNGTGDGGTEGPPVDPRVCDEARAHVTSLYRAEMPNTQNATADVAALEEQIVADNVDMMLIECRANARRFVPCLASAVSVAQMERDCLVALDDQGSEGSQFSKQR